MELDNANLSKHKFVYRITAELINRDFSVIFRKERYKIIYINELYLYFKRSGQHKLTELSIPILMDENKIIENVKSSFNPAKKIMIRSLNTNFYSNYIGYYYTLDNFKTATIQLSDYDILSIRKQKYLKELQEYTMEYNSLSDRLMNISCKISDCNKIIEEINEKMGDVKNLQD